MKYLKTAAFYGFSFALSFSLLASTSLTAKTIWLEEDDYRLAQGDADGAPADFQLSDEEMALDAAAMKTASVQKEVKDDGVIPTLTAEGDFLLPTYVLPDAAKTTVATTAAPVDAANPWRAETTVRTVAAPTTTPAVNDQLLLDTMEKQYQDTTALLAATARRLESLENNVNDLKQTNVQLASNDVVSAEPARRQPLLLPLAPRRPDVAVSQPVEPSGPKVVAAEQSGYVDYVLQVIKKVEQNPVEYTLSDELVIKTIPNEMKISFMPDSADISTQSFKWIKAFSYRPRMSVQNIVEIRLSAQDLDLQSRRFALIKGALLSNGLSPRQIRFVMTDRDPDTIVLRSIIQPNEEEIYFERQKNGTVIPQKIQKW